MADYFTNFSCVLNTGSTENSERALEIYHNLRMEYGAEGIDVLFVVSAEDNEPKSLWIRDSTSGDPEHVTEFVRRCGHSLGLTGLWGFEWANTCSRPHLEAFGGGAIVIDLEDGRLVDSVATNDWLTRYLESGVSDVGSH